jgi:Ca-activated chloride channel family protein
MPAPEVDLSAGIAAATVPARPGSFVEVRLDEGDDVEHAARLGAEAVLTVVFDEGEATEKIVEKRFSFARGGPAVKRFSLDGGAVTEVAR